MLLIFGGVVTRGGTFQESEPAKRRITSIVRQTLDAFARNDLDGVRESWAENSDFASFKIEFDITRAGYDQITFNDLRFTRWELGSEHAMVRIAFLVKGRDRSTGKAFEQSLVWDFGLIAVDGHWLISIWDVPRANLDRRLLELDSREERLRFLQREKDLLDLSLVLSLLENGDHLAQEGDHIRGQKEIDAACEIAETLDRSDALAACYKARGDLFSYQYKQSEALSNYQRSLVLFKTLADLKGQRASQLGIGNAYVRSGDYQSALNTFQQALNLGRKIPELGGDSVSLKQIGVVYESMGLYADALDNYGKSLQAADDAHDELAKASAQINLGNVYFQVGRPTEAEKSYSDALRAYNDFGDEGAEAGARINLGNYFMSEHDYEKALQQYDLSLRIGNKRQDRLIVAASLSGMGHVYLLKGQYGEARGKLETSLQLAREAGTPQEQATRLLELGYLDAVTGNDGGALSRYSQAKAISTRLQDIDTVFRSDNLIGDLRLTQRNWPAASEAFQSAVNEIEQVREHASAPFLQTSFFGQFTASYGGLIKSSYEMGKYETAFSASELAKARTLVEIMRTSHATVTKSLTTAERSRESRLIERMTGITNQLDELKEPESEEAAELNRQLNVARSDYETLRDQLFVVHRELRVQRAQFAPLHLNEIHHALFLNRPGLRILSYAITEHGVFLFVLTPGTRNDSTLRIHVLKSAAGEDLTERELRARVLDFRQKCSHPDAPYVTGARDLYQLLVTPAREELKGANQLLIVPDGVLLTLPFQALINEHGDHLLETASLSYAPSITAVIEMLKISDRRRANSKRGIGTSRVLAMGVSSFDEIARYRDRNLPFADDQVREVVALLGGRGFTGPTATEANAKLLMGKVRYIHLVTHGEVNGKAPMFSSIVLRKGGGEDGWLFARELMDIDLHADMVTLAACQTALGQETRGEGLLGLSWAIFVAGAGSSVLTQWEVLDTSTNELVSHFYQHLRDNRFSRKAESLRMAQLDLMKNPKFKHPYFWAPFTLMGDWR